MYKVVFVDSLSFSGAEEMLNEAAELGYRVIGMFNITNRAAIVMEKRADRGRPRKKESEADLGD